MTATARRALYALVAFGVWTLLVWGGRVRNIAADETLSGAGKVARLGLATSFVVFALLSLAWAARERRTGLPPRTMYLLGPFAAWTVGVWLVRGVDIVIGDHSAAFVIVHLVLAAVSIGLAALAVTSLRREADVEREGEAPAATARL